MACVVEAGGIKIFIDPGVSFAPRRYGLPPHPLEIARLEEVQYSIMKELEDTDIVIISHYHYDHYLYRQEHIGVYSKKKLIVKHPLFDINLSQKLRAHRFLKKHGVELIADEVIYGDNRIIKLDDNIVIAISAPVPHGPDGTSLGKVIMTLIECCGYRFVHASDVQGPMNEAALRVLEKWHPDVVFISGPPIYFGEEKVTKNDINRGLKSLAYLAKLVSELLIVDHHMARSLDYKQVLARIIGSEYKSRVVSAAEFMGVPFEPLEALRKRLWNESKKAPNSD